VTRKARVLRRSLALAALATASLCGTADANHSLKEHVTIGPAGGNGAVNAFFDAASQDGLRVVFETSESLVGPDSDTAFDIYERAGTTTTLLSTGSSGGNGANDAFFDAASDDGSRVFFDTDESLVAADTDSSIDVYQRSGGTTTLVSTGPAGGNGANDVTFDGISKDGTHVFFETDESLVSGDSDGQTDLYERSGGTTTLVSTGPTAGSGGGATPIFDSSSDDGTRVFFETDEKLVSGDTDAQYDLYERSGGSTTLVSTGPAGGNGAIAEFYEGNSQSGARVCFSTAESLVAPDTDSQSDVYERSGGTTTLVSTGPSGGNGAFGAFYDGSSGNGSHVFFHTAESLLLAADTDAKRDVYDRSGGTTTLISTGPSGGNGPNDAFFEGSSLNGSLVWFSTTESLVGTDTDVRSDVYERLGGTTSRISTGSNGGNGGFDSFFAGASLDGSRVFFTTAEPLEPSDTDASTDVYERFSGATTHISIGSPGGNGALAAFFDGASADGGRAFFNTRESLLGSDTDTARDVYAAAVNGFPRPRGATPFLASLVPAYQACSAPNRTHGPPLSSGSCNPPAQASSRLTVGTLDANGQAANSVGSVRYDAKLGNSVTPTNEADVLVVASITDVRRQSDLLDYTGELLLTATMRITDKNNAVGAGGGTDSATLTDLDFPATIPCVGTSSTSVGSTCTLATTFNAIQPGAIVEEKRAIWQIGPVDVFDGGADGLASTTPNTLFETQGLFAP
jgi:hypothetical protein